MARRLFSNLRIRCEFRFKTIVKTRVHADVHCKCIDSKSDIGSRSSCISVCVCARARVRVCMNESELLISEWRALLGRIGSTGTKLI
jgi:hypothetical protein